MKTLPYENATAGAGALQELQRVLENFGCSNFGTMIDADEQVVTVAFTWQKQRVCLNVSWKGYAAMWLKRHPYKFSSRVTRQQHEARALEQGRASVCSVLRDWAKSQLMAVECGAMKFDEVFMPHMLLSNGMRVVDAARQAKVLPQIGQDSQGV